MKLLHVAIDGVGRFGTPVRLEGLGPGVNILSAHNEAGKSTMFRAIRTCLFERHNTTRDEVKKLATEGLSLPAKITIGFEHEGQTFELTKSFLRSPSAKLTRNSVEIARNREADEGLWEILGITPDNKIDQGAYGVLWVEQGQSFYVPEPSEAATSVLNNVIQQEVGTLVGGERARQLLKEVKDELGKLLTDGGKAKTTGPLGVAQRHLEAIEQQRIEAEKRLAELDGNLEKLSSQRAEFVRVNEPVETRRLSVELSEAETAFKSAEESTQSLRQFVNEERQALLLLTAQQDTLKSLQERAKSIDENRTRFNGLNVDYESLNEAIGNATSELTNVNNRKFVLDGEAGRNEAEDLQLQRMASLSQRAAARATLQARLTLLQSFDKRLLENEQALRSISADDTAKKALDTIERDIETISLRMDSAAARLTIKSKPHAVVSLNGENVPPHLSRAITEPLTIIIGDDVTVTLSPPATSLAAADTARREQHVKLRTLLSHHGVSSAEEFHIVRAERAVLEEESRNLKAERTALGLKEPNASSDIRRLQIEIRQIDSETQRALAETANTPLPSPTMIEQQRQSLRETRNELKASIVQAGSVIAGLTETINRNAQQRAALVGQTKELNVRIAADLALLPDASRQQLLGKAERELEQRVSNHRTQAALLAEKQHSAPSPEELDRLRLRAGRLQRAAVNRDKEIADLRERIAILTGQVQSAGGEGLGERVTELQVDSAIALAEVARQTERAEVLKLLRDTVGQAYDMRREQLNAPLHRHLKPFLQDVFPQAEIALGDGFSVEGLKRSGLGSELFGRLSHGTQEQIAVLVRLAMGAMICEKGHDVPIILDDALVYSDDARIEQMFDAINRAGRNQQVIVLTCRARSFASLGGNQLRIT